MKHGQVIPLATQQAFGTNMLKRIVAHQGFHTVDRDRNTSDALRVVLSDSGLGHELLSMCVVFIDMADEYIASVVHVVLIDQHTRDLLLSPFGEFNQTGTRGPIIQPGVHLLFGPVHAQPEFRVREDYSSSWSYRPRHVLPSPE